MPLAPLTAVAALLAVPSLTSSAFAKDFYVDPVKGAKTGDGSKEKPWKTLEEVVADKLISRGNGRATRTPRARSSSRRTPARR